MSPGEDVDPIGPGLQEAVELWASAQQTDRGKRQGDESHFDNSKNERNWPI